MFIPSYKKPSSGGGGYVPCSWADGTDEEIVEALEQHYAGNCDLHEYWSVGDERVVNLSAMSAVRVGESHAAQSVTFVLSNIGGKYLADGVTECVFQVDQKNCLSESGYMNSVGTNVGGWKNSNRRSWCNDRYYEAIPSTLRPIFKQHINQSCVGGSSATDIENTIDYFALRAEIEVQGSVIRSVTGEGSQITWYQTSANILKKIGDSGSVTNWWLRSPNTPGGSSSFVMINTQGKSANSAATQVRYLSPFGCI